jgi:uncharacterized membrane protein YwzB
LLQPTTPFLAKRLWALQHLFFFIIYQIVSIFFIYSVIRFDLSLTSGFVTGTKIALILLTIVLAVGF